MSSRGRWEVGSRQLYVPLEAADVCICHLVLDQRHGLPKRMRVRIDRPKHLAGKDIPVGKAQHAHVQQGRGGSWHDVLVVNQDGTASHNTPAGTEIPWQVADILRDRGFEIDADNRVKFLSAWHSQWIGRMVRNTGAAPRQIIVIVEAPFPVSLAANDD
jgi:hypothetical protein